MDRLSTTGKAIRTAKWATTMTRWRIGFEVGGRAVGKTGVKRPRRWQLVGFPGPGGRESSGIVDLIAIRKNHATPNGSFKRGDLFEIILIQIKGGGARHPTVEDIQRLHAVAKYYHAQDVVLAEWVKATRLQFYRLRKNHRIPRSAWEKVDPGEIFC